MHLVGDGLPPAWAGPTVVRIAPEAQRYAALQREAELQGWVAGEGFPAPRVVELIEPGAVFPTPAIVVERVPGTTMTQVMTTKPWLLPAMVRTLARLHAGLHRMATPPAGVDAAPRLADKRLHLVRLLLAAHPIPELADALARTDELLPALEVDPPQVCHGDFHPMNLLVDGRSAVAIDWTDAALGDRHGDVARTAWLFRMAAVGAPSRAERLVMRAVGPQLSRAYLKEYRRHLPLEQGRLTLWMPLHLLHLWALTLADETGFRGASQAGAGFNPALGEWARAQFHSSLRQAQEALR
jgi:aminoglycoside phosphotransferase (APT) family kinase protein